MKCSINQKKAKNYLLIILILFFLSITISILRDTLNVSHLRQDCSVGLLDRHLVGVELASTHHQQSPPRGDISFHNHKILSPPHHPKANNIESTIHKHIFTHERFKSSQNLVIKNKESDFKKYTKKLEPKKTYKRTTKTIHDLKLIIINSQFPIINCNGFFRYLGDRSWVGVRSTT